MPRAGETGQLYLKNKLVGRVVVRRYDASWTYADFTPADGFSEFALLFGSWSLLFHADSDALSSAASKELRRLENQIDRLKAQVHFDASGQWHNLAQLNIDQGAAEWKEY